MVGVKVLLAIIVIGFPDKSDQLTVVGSSANVPDVIAFSVISLVLFLAKIDGLAPIVNTLSLVITTPTPPPHVSYHLSH